MSSVNERLREVRHDAGMSQTEFGAIGGVLKQAQMKYEGGKRQPDGEYLDKLRRAGYDVGYIVTGFRRDDVPSGAAYVHAREEAKPLAAKLITQRDLPDVEEVFETLVMLAATEGVTYTQVVYVADAFKAALGNIRPEEHVLLDHYRAADKRGKAAILTTAAALSAGVDPHASRATHHVNADRGGIAGGHDVTVGSPPRRTTRRKK